MNQERWTAVDQYIGRLLMPSDPALDAALVASAAAGLPSINVSPAQGKLLHLLARAQRARRILEIGTLGGYSTIWLARALEPGGKVITLEYNATHARVAQQNLDHAGVAGLVEIRQGRALDTLPKLAAEKAGPFDFIFIDADKPAITEYFDWSIRLSRIGTTIIVDNVVRDGEVIDAGSTDANVQGVRRFNDALAAERRVSATTIQTVGSKGYDGFTLAVVV